MYLALPPHNPVQPGDLVMRPKHSGWGFHYGTGVSGALVAHTTPEMGKHVGPLEEFADGKHVAIRRPNRHPFANFAVEQRALSDLGRPYDAIKANCEHDVTTVHDGVARSPMLQSVVIGLSIGSILALLFSSSEN